MQVKIESSKKPANREDWGSTLNIQPQVRFNKMLSASLLPYSTRYAPAQQCKFIASLQSSLWAEAANNAMLLENNLSLPTGPLAHLNNFLERERSLS